MSNQSWPHIHVQNVSIFKYLLFSKFFLVFECFQNANVNKRNYYNGISQPLNKLRYAHLHCVHLVIKMRSKPVQSETFQYPFFSKAFSVWAFQSQNFSVLKFSVSDFSVRAFQSQNFSVLKFSVPDFSVRAFQSQNFSV